MVSITIRCVLFLSIYALLLSLSNSSAKHCFGVPYKIISDSRRSTGYVIKNKQNRLCDQELLEDNTWYRFLSEAGGEIPTAKPKRESCGTYIPIWMNGSHPRVEHNIVARKACANEPFVFPIGCGYSYNIHVRNCSGYYIYKLKKPSGCFRAYCAGKLVQCIYTLCETQCRSYLMPYLGL